MSRRFSLAALITMVLAGCATLHESECRTGDWYGIGLTDGRLGRVISRVEDHRKACAKHAVAVQDLAYHQGREQGLREYCVIDNALQSGLDGRPYHGVCPSPLDADFRRMHGAALDVHRAREAIDSTLKQIEGKERQLADKGTNDKQGARLRDEIRSLDRRRQRERENLLDFEHRLDRVRGELRHRQGLR